MTAFDRFCIGSCERIERVIGARQIPRHSITAANWCKCMSIHVNYLIFAITCTCCRRLSRISVGVCKRSQSLTKLGPLDLRSASLLRPLQISRHSPKSSEAQRPTKDCRMMIPLLSPVQISRCASVGWTVHLNWREAKIIGLKEHGCEKIAISM